MYPASEEFKQAVRGPHNVTLRAEVWRGGDLLRSLDVVDGSVEVDARRAQRRTMSITVPASKPTVELSPVYNTYQSIRGVVVEWGTTDPGLTWAGAGGFTWFEGDYLSTTQQPAEFNTYLELAAGFATYGDLPQIVSYSETTVDDGLIPSSPFSDVTPFGNEIRLWRGVKVMQALYPTYGSIAGVKVSWDLVSNSLTWGSVSASVAWINANDLPI